jgi:hypothetical protein
VEALRQPDRLPRCYELTDEERLQKALAQSQDHQERNRLLANDFDLDNHYYWGS